MFAVAFDLDTRETERSHPKSLTQAYADIGVILRRFDFDWRQGSVYTCDVEDHVNLTRALLALKALPWFPASVRDIRVFRVEQWSDFTGFMKE